MKHHLLLIVPLSALMLFLAVQVYMIDNIWQQKEEILNMRYASLSREGLSLLVLKKRINGFEKPMDVIDKFAGVLVNSDKETLLGSKDSTALKKQILKQTYAALYKNENLTPFLRSYFKDSKHDSEFNPAFIIFSLQLLTNDGPISIIDTMPSMPGKKMVFVESFKEENNNFRIKYGYLLDITGMNKMVFREAFLSMALVIASIIIVLLVFWLTWHNLTEERRLSELKTDFINNMTHELKTPLSTITVAGRTLEKEQVLSDPGRILDTAHLIGKQSIHLNQMINTILEVSLLERSEFELNKQEADLNELTHEIVTSFLTSCDGCAKIKEDYEQESLPVSVDILYYTTVINNLLSNAVKYCTQEPNINLAIKSEDGKVSITVADNGIGIAREHLDHIFEKFYRVPHGNIHKIKGLGLGLYYVKKIINAHGGDVSVTSKQGHGTIFKIKLPK